MTEQRRRWELTLDARQSSLGEAADFMEEVCGVMDLDADIAFAVRLATEEACQNAVEHACHFDPDQEFTLVCEKVGADLVIRVTERGDPFDLARAVPPRLDVPLAERNGGGLGIHFMRKMMDEVRYSRDADGVNSVTMVKRDVFAGEQSPSAHEGSEHSTRTSSPALGM